MESKEIQELIELISRSNFKSFELERDDFKLKLVKHDAAAVLTAPVAAALEQPAGIAGHAATAAPASLAAAPVAAEGTATDGLQELNSPIVGTFYAAPSPSAPNFVEVGARVAKGQVLCIVEAMKVMNEIESEIDAEVAEVLVSNGQPVEYGEVLFRLRPLAP